MKQFVTLLLSFFLILVTAVPVDATKISGCYLAVISSPDLSWWFIEKPSWEVDDLEIMYRWDQFEDKLKHVSQIAGDQLIVIDLLVHGSEDGLCVATGSGAGEVQSWTTMGYALSEVERIFAGKRVCVLFESCYSGRAYKQTIRGNELGGNFASHVPPFPVWGAGDSFRVYGPIMYLQLKYDFMKWWVDLRTYDSLGANRPLHPIEAYVKGKMEKTTEEMSHVVDFFAALK